MVGGTQSQAWRSGVGGGGVSQPGLDGGGVHHPGGYPILGGTPVRSGQWGGGYPWLGILGGVPRVPPQPGLDGGGIPHPRGTPVRY